MLASSVRPLNKVSEMKTVSIMSLSRENEGDNRDRIIEKIRVRYRKELQEFRYQTIEAEWKIFIMNRLIRDFHITSQIMRYHCTSRTSSKIEWLCCAVRDLLIALKIS
jgi:hypothetical protein